MSDRSAARTVPGNQNVADILTEPFLLKVVLKQRQTGNLQQDGLSSNRKLLILRGRSGKRR
ncbi:MAG TPA: hypothetical protein DCG12_14060 [Planctomycetaceae bacterium]|nr:hypothetical protein [Planctomycetaceae bacterium]